MINELSNIAHYIGGNIDFVNFRAYAKEEIASRLLNVDLIYIVGGKQLVLSKLFEETKTTELLKKIATDKVIMGTSAGAIVLGKQIISSKYWKERYNMNIEEIEDTKPLELVEFNIIPHFMREDRQQWDRDFYTRTLRNNPFPLYALTDSQALIYDEGKVEYVGGNPVIFGNNK